jgi:hypothetical protein
MIWLSNPGMDKRMFFSPKRLERLCIIFRLFSRVLKKRRVKVTTNLHPVTRLRMAGAISLLSVYAYVA